MQPLRACHQGVFPPIICPAPPFRSIQARCQRHFRWQGVPQAVALFHRPYSARPGRGLAGSRTHPGTSNRHVWRNQILRTKLVGGSPTFFKPWHQEVKSGNPHPTLASRKWQDGLIGARRKRRPLQFELPLLGFLRRGQNRLSPNTFFST